MSANGADALRKLRAKLDKHCAVSEDAMMVVIIDDEMQDMRNLLDAYLAGPAKDDLAPYRHRNFGIENQAKHLLRRVQAVLSNSELGGPDGYGGTYRLVNSHAQRSLTAIANELGEMLWPPVKQFDPCPDATALAAQSGINPQS